MTKKGGTTIHNKSTNSSSSSSSSNSSDHVGSNKTTTTTTSIVSEEQLINTLVSQGDAIKYIDEIVSFGSLGLDKRDDKSLVDNKSTGTTDLLNDPLLLQNYFTSVVDTLIDLKKHLYNNVHNELEKSARVDILSIQREIQSLEENTLKSFQVINDKNSIVGRIRSNISYDQQLRKRLESIESTLVMVDYFEEYDGYVKAYEKAIKENDIVQSTRHLVKMETMVNIGIPDSLQSMQPLPRILPSIKDQLKKRKNQLKTQLLEEFTNALVINHLEISLARDNIYQLIGALEQLGLLYFIVSSISNQIYKSIIQPLLSTVQARLSLTKNESQPTIDISKNGNHLKLTIDIQEKNKISTIDNLFNILKNMFEFIYNHIFGKENRLMERFGTDIWSDISTTIISNCLKNIIPDDPSQLSLFQSIQSKPFEEYLVQIGLINSTQQSITEFINNIESHFAEKKRHNLLAKARHIIMTDKFDSIDSSESVIGESQQNNGSLQLYYFTPRSIFKNANTLIQMCKTALYESLQSSPLCSTKIYQGCRDIFDMFRFMYIKYHKDKIKTVPLLACLYYNSCLFLSHSFLILSFEFQQLKKEKDTTLFLDFSPIFSKHANEYFSSYLMDQLNFILSYYDGCNGLDDTKDEFIMNRTESSFKRMVNELTRLSQTCRSSLTREDYFGLISHFVDRVLAKFIELVLKLENISTIETTKLSQLCSQFLSLEQLFLYDDESEEMVKPRLKLVRNWKKVWQLNKILDLNLSEIVTLYNKGELKRLSNSELKLLVMSIFAEFDLRTTFLKTLSTTN
ncbi:centrosomal protein [Cavenderia fasciculata]|uniref:Centrosomal protein n=1 Tax=Cavenderia fasciculata TaxID=261658 RepID=F4PXD8_CACFS|nr:centrosomal protein [Cavenderia fasciculata]EGG19448.1 centrosomal protein [Cavenderia fasciculata]|eukprot:XP_004357742.1 centrosomal protein [Cavenderia fasciculata]